MKRKTIIFLLLSLLIAGFVYAILNVEYGQAMGIKEYSNLPEQKKEQPQKLLAQITSISSDYFTVMDIEFPENTVTYYFDPEELDLSEFAIGETIFATVEKEKGLKIEKIQSTTATQYLAKRKPLLKISLLEYPEQIKNSCEEFTLRIKAKNYTDITIKYEDLFNDDFGYSLFFHLNDTYLVSESLEDFNEIKPGEEKTLTFRTNINTNNAMVKGKNTIQFSWGKKSLYNEELVTLENSETITVFMLEDFCE